LTAISRLKPRRATEKGNGYDDRLLATALPIQTAANAWLAFISASTCDRPLDPVGQTSNLRRLPALFQGDDLHALTIRQPVNGEDYRVFEQCKKTIAHNS